MSRTARLAGAAVVAYCLARTTTGESAPSAPRSVAVVVLGCGAELGEVRELPDRLAVELAPVRIEAGAAAVLEVATSCTAVESVTFRPAAASGEVARPTTRSVSLADVTPALRGVALAVVTAEFLRSTWAPPVGTASMPGVPEPPEEAAPAPSAAAPAPAVPPEERKPVEAPPKTSPVADRPVGGKAPRPPGLRLGVAGLARWFSRPASTLGGGELSLDRTPWLAAANVAVGSQRDALGSVGVGVAALSLGGRLRLARTETFAWAAVGLGEIGFTWASAASGDTSVQTGSTGALFAALMLGPELEVSLARALDLNIGLRGGVARGLTITSDGREIAGTQGFAVASSVGLRYAP